MIEYLRIPKNKFWGWVFTSLAVGLLLGAVITYAFARASSTKQIDDLKKQVETQTAQSASTAASLQAQLDSREASLTALNDKYTTLQQQVSSAKTSSTSSSSSSANSTATLEVKARSVRPSTVATSANITLTAQVQGSPSKVTMRVYNKTTGYDQTYSLKRYSHTSSTETWRLVTSAPKKRGTYHYYSTAYKGSKSATQPGASPGTFTVD